MQDHSHDTAGSPRPTGTAPVGAGAGGSALDPHAADRDLDLTLMLCTRLCHDLAGPIGAVATGAELLAEEAADRVDADTLALLGDSARLAAARLKLLRLATGVAKGRQPSLSEARTALSDAFALAGRAVVVEDADGGGPATDPGPVGVRLLLVAVLVAAEIWPRAPRLSLVPGAPTDPGGWTIRAEGAGAPEPLWREILSAPPALDAPPPDPRAALAVFAARLAARDGAGLDLGDSGSAGLSVRLAAADPAV